MQYVQKNKAFLTSLPRPKKFRKQTNFTETNLVFLLQPICIFLEDLVKIGSAVVEISPVNKKQET